MCYLITNTWWSFLACDSERRDEKSFEVLSVLPFHGIAISFPKVSCCFPHLICSQNDTMLCFSAFREYMHIYQESKKMLVYWCFKGSS